jgi:hypothetical protein
MDGTTPPNRRSDSYGTFVPDGRRQSFHSNTGRCTATVVSVAVEESQHSKSPSGCHDLFSRSRYHIKVAAFANHRTAYMHAPVSTLLDRHTDHTPI